MENINLEIPKLKKKRVRKKKFPIKTKLGHPQKTRPKYDLLFKDSYSSRMFFNDSEVEKAYNAIPYRWSQIDE